MGNQGTDPVKRLVAAAQSDRAFRGDEALGGDLVTEAFRSRADPR